MPTARAARDGETDERTSASTAAPPYPMSGIAAMCTPPMNRWKSSVSCKGSSAASGPSVARPK